VKIAALDKELKGYKDKLKKTSSAAGKKVIQKRAMDVLKRKRLYEQQRDQMMNQQFNIDSASFGVESAKATVGTVAALKAASSELKTTLKNDLDIDNIEDVTDDMAELMEDFGEINEALGRNFSTPEDIDESELEAELDMLGDELEEEEALNEATPSYLQDNSLPTQPTAVPGQKVSSQTGAMAQTT